MEISDIQEIWTHIKALHPNTPEEKRPRLSGRIAKVWANELSGYSVEQVIKAVESHAGKCRYWPDLSEIKAELPGCSIAGATRPQPRGDADLRAKEAQDRLFAQMKAERERLIPLRRVAGIPATVEEAKAEGMTATEWWNQCERAGLNYPDGIFRKEAMTYGTL